MVSVLQGVAVDFFFDIYLCVFGPAEASSDNFVFRKIEKPAATCQNQNAPWPSRQVGVDVAVEHDSRGAPRYGPLHSLSWKGEGRWTQRLTISLERLVVRVSRDDCESVFALTFLRVSLRSWMGPLKNRRTDLITEPRCPKMFRGSTSSIKWHLDLLDTGLLVSCHQVVLLGLCAFKPRRICDLL